MMSIWEPSWPWVCCVPEVVRMPKARCQGGRLCRPCETSHGQAKGGMPRWLASWTMRNWLWACQRQSWMPSQDTKVANFIGNAKLVMGMPKAVMDVELAMGMQHAEGDRGH